MSRCLSWIVAGLLHVGDIIKEVNGIPVYTPQMLMDIIRNADGGVTLKIIPAYIEQHHTSQVSAEITAGCCWV